ncbi:hypothetical protein [Kitasatospora sp. NPDC059673]|uniref:hypothetical protein n=1 Tax=Kitasatospora sp. NPDC059673 TaxID=3346901 RepID=UPI003693E2F6
MKRALALAAVTVAALFAAVSPASADTAPAAPTTLQQQLPTELPTTPLGGDTSWGGACETPNCQPWN